MVVNSDKFQSILINRLEKLKDSYNLQIDDQKIDYLTGNYMFKVNDRNTRAMASFWCPYC